MAEIKSFLKPPQSTEFRNYCKKSHRLHCERSELYSWPNFPFLFTLFFWQGTNWLWKPLILPWDALTWHFGQLETVPILHIDADTQGSPQSFFSCQFLLRAWEDPISVLLSREQCQGIQIHTQYINYLLKNLCLFPTFYNQNLPKNFCRAKNAMRIIPQT